MWGADFKQAAMMTVYEVTHGAKVHNFPTLKDVYL